MLLYVQSDPEMHTLKYVIRNVASRNALLPAERAKNMTIKFLSLRANNLAMVEMNVQPDFGVPR